MNWNRSWRYSGPNLVRILTNMALPQRWCSSCGFEGETVLGRSVAECAARLSQCDAVLIDSEPRLLERLAALFLAHPGRRKPLLGSDIVLRRPETVMEWLRLPIHRLLLAQVDHFLLPFRDLRGYQKYFGIGPARSSFYRFKPNLRYRSQPRLASDGVYVLCLGHAMRDFDGFFDAIEKLGYPAAIAEPNWFYLRAGRSRFTRRLEQLPPSVRRLQHDHRDAESQEEILLGAKLVVVPMRKQCLVAPGTPYNAMLLGKCVLVTEGPGTHGLYDDGEVLTMPAEDPDGMAAVIQRAWQDRELRERTAAKGHALALSLGGTPELQQRLIDGAVQWLRGAGLVPVKGTGQLARG